MKQIIGLFQNFALSDLVDILVVSVLLYRFLLIIKGTRAVQMLIGLGALVILFGLSLSYRLYSLNWILSHFFESFFVILVVLFQDHIRQVLANVGKAKFWGGKKSSQMGIIIDEVVEATKVLAQEKTGAIMVFEKANGLLNYAVTGTFLEANIHSDIIYSLFQESSPLHDGAIIFSGEKIQAAGCFLPLSKNVDIDRHYGTRHRAAIGITQLTDAVVVTVSEETGKIHVCFEGQLKEMKEVTELEDVLLKLLTFDKNRGINFSLEWEKGS